MFLPQQLDYFRPGKAFIVILCDGGFEGFPVELIKISGSARLCRIILLRKSRFAFHIEIGVMKPDFPP